LQKDVFCFLWQVIRSEDADNKALNTLVDVLQSEEMQDHMLENFDGAVLPATGNNE